MKGFSARNLKYMRAFAKAWPEEQFVQQAAAQIPWFHNNTILEKVKDDQARRFYIEHAQTHGWSRSILTLQIESQLHVRQDKSVTNFTAKLPPPQSDLAQQITKDPHCFDFLTLQDPAQERDLERGLVEHIRDFLLGRKLLDSPTLARVRESPANEQAMKGGAGSETARFTITPLKADR